MGIIFLKHVPGAAVPLVATVTNLTRRPHWWDADVRMCEETGHGKKQASEK